MTRIITITSGLGQVGKTHLAVNAALELVRRGRSVGLYHEGGGHASINQLLKLPNYASPKDPAEKVDVICRGYQGVDIISSRILLSNWNGLNEERVASLVEPHEAWTDYDDFLIDTSGMSPHAVVACCKVSQMVVLVVTPESQSQAEAFALLKVLRLNDLDSAVALVVNMAEDDARAEEVHARFAAEVSTHLGMDIPLLGTVANAGQVASAQRARQAVTSVFPESAVSIQISRLVEALGEQLESVHKASVPLHDFWHALAENIRAPVHLAGKASLAEYEAQERATHAGAATDSDAGGDEATLLRYEGPLAKLDNVMQSFSGVLHFIADDMLLLHRRLADLNVHPDRTEQWSRVDEGVLELSLAAILKVLKDAINNRQQVCFQVEEQHVTEDDVEWLRAGQYIKYVFIVPAQGDAMDLIGGELEHISDLRHTRGEDGECICEAITAARDGCLGVVHTPQGEIRVHYWHRPDSGAQPESEDTARNLSAGSGADHHPPHKLLH